MCCVTSLLLMKLYFFAATYFACFGSHFKVNDYEKISMEFGHAVAEHINASCIFSFVYLVKYLTFGV